MQAELRRDVSKAGAAVPGIEIAEIKGEKRAVFDIKNRNLEKYIWELSSEMEQRPGSGLRGISERRFYRCLSLPADATRMRRNMIDPLLEVKSMPRQVTPASLVLNRENALSPRFPRQRGGKATEHLREEKYARASLMRLCSPTARAGFAFGR